MNPQCTRTLACPFFVQELTATSRPLSQLLVLAPITTKFNELLFLMKLVAG